MGSAFHQLCPRYSGTLTPHCPYGYWAMGHLYLYLLTSQNNVTLPTEAISERKEIVPNGAKFSFSFIVMSCFENGDKIFGVASHENVSIHVNQQEK